MADLFVKSECIDEKHRICNEKMQPTEECAIGMHAAPSFGFIYSLDLVLT